MRLCAVTVGVEDECAGMGEVAWSERAAGDGMTRLTLEAKAEDGYVFSGWSVAGSDDVDWPSDMRYPAPSAVTVSTAAVVRASFIPVADDNLEFDFGDLFPDEIECYGATEVPVDVDSQSFPTLMFSGLPPGISHKTATLTLSGRPTTPGIYHVSCSGTNGSGFTFQDFFTIRVGNVSGSRVMGEDLEIPLGEYYEAEFAESEFGDSTIFSCGEGWKKVDLSGLPPGLSWRGESDWETVSGTPTKTGDYTVTARVTFSNETTEVATLIMSVVAPDPSEYGVDLDGLGEMHVGDRYEHQSDVIGSYDVFGAGIEVVTGLPSGLTAKSWIENKVRYWGIGGRVEKVGRYEVSVKVSYFDGAEKKLADTRRVIVVRDVPDRYLSVVSADASMGTVTGGGAVSAVDDVTIVARPKSGYVFVGWYDEDGEHMTFDEGTDYRMPSVTFSAGTEFAFYSLYAHFTSKADDSAPEFVGFDGEEYSFSANESMEEIFEIDSPSLPELSFKGLPVGVACVPDGTGAFILRYDGSSGAGPSPGRYAVAATAKNQSGRISTASCLVTVTNLTDPRIQVEDDYGECVPGEEIDAIDLSDAVDFGRGETLAVSSLPKGLTYNAKANEKKGIKAYTITGTPTAPGYYTLTFTAKVVTSATTNAGGKVSYKYETAKATSFMTILPYPEVVIEVDDDALEAGNKVTGGGNYKAGTKVTLTAKAAKGWVFAGWEGLDGVGSLEALSPKLSYVTTSDDVFVYAKFIEVRDDWLYVDEPDLTEAGYAAELKLNESVDELPVASLIAGLIDTGSYPTVKVTDLPKGLKFSASTFLLSGKPTKGGVYHTTVTVKNASGYSFVRVLNIAVLEKDGTLPEDAKFPNEADIDFEPIADLMTGGYCPPGAVVLAVGTQPETDASVRKVALSGLPAGLVAVSTVKDGEAVVEITGTPTKPGRQILTVKVTYDNGKSATSQHAVVVRDGGSYYLDVQSLFEEGGTVTGSGIYAAGAKVSLSAKAKSKHVFSGWLCDGRPFAMLQEIDGIDYRTVSVSFAFRPDTLSDNMIYGDFATAEEDNAVAIDFDSDVWGIDPQKTSSCGFAVSSKSLPKLTVSGLPKGVTADLARGAFFYEPNASATPGIYPVAVSVKNSTVKSAVADSFEIRIANSTSEVIGGLDPDMDAYRITVGTELDSGLIVPEVDEDWTLSVKGLPSGLSYKNGVISGVPAKEGNYTVTFTATTGKGTQKRTELATITIRVAALPMTATGVFNGFLFDEDKSVVGTMAVTATAAGKVSAVAEIPSMRVSFSTKAWDAFSDGKAEVAMVGKNDSAVALVVDTNGEWTEWQLEGTCRIGGVDYAIKGQRNPYGKKDGIDEARVAIEKMVGTSTLEGWTAKISKDGVVKMTGKYEGKSIFGSVTMMYNDGFFARYIKFIDKKRILYVGMVFDDDGTMQSVEADMY